MQMDGIVRSLTSPHVPKIRFLCYLGRKKRSENKSSDFCDYKRWTRTPIEDASLRSRDSLHIRTPYCRRKMLVSLVVLGLLASASAQVNLLHGPLLTGATSFTFIVSTSTVVKPSPCYVTSGEVSQCRRRRGIEELPIIKEVEKIAPSEVVG